jgi:cytochrome c biogenesis protein CcmG, thiol:disulfide interchange protein DsbE
MADFDPGYRRSDGAPCGTAGRFLRWTAALLCAACSLAFAATEGKPAPSFHARLLDGSSFDLAQDQGKVVVVHMWATWCGPCREEMPALDAYYRRHRDEGLILIALSMDEPENEAKVRDLAKAFSFPVGLARDAEMRGYGRIWKLPLNFVVDRRGVLRKDQWQGDPGLDAKALEQNVTPLLREP